MNIITINKIQRISNGAPAAQAWIKPNAAPLSPSFATRGQSHLVCDEKKTSITPTFPFRTPNHKTTFTTKKKSSHKLTVKG
jgi:hypothetical protein